MSKYQKCKETFESAIDLLQGNSGTEEQFINVLKELTNEMFGPKDIVQIFLCRYLQTYCFNYKLDRTYGGQREIHDRRPFHSTQEELAYIMQSILAHRGRDYTEDLKRIAREMSELVYERGWENNPF